MTGRQPGEGPHATGNREADAERDLFRVLFDAMPELAWTARADGYIDRYNRGWYEYTGTTYEEMKGWGWQSVHHPDELPRVLALWKRSIATGQPFELQFPLRRRDGVFRQFLTRARPLYDEAGNLVRWIGINTDVDDQKRAERHAEELRAMAELAVRARDDLLAIVSHDLRNPLNTVIMAAHQIAKLVDSGDAARAKKGVVAILRAVDRMSRLVSDLLDLAKLEAGHLLAVDLRRVNVAELARQVAVDLEPLVRACKLTLSIDLGAAAYAVCDRDRVEQALTNLIGNAIKFTREGGSIRLAVRASDGEIVVSVTDTGIGIASDQLPHIFKPYWQADAQRKTGAGLGLSIVKLVMDAHGGRTWVDSAPGRGSTFFVSLPAVEPMHAPEGLK